jgi:hypothetical protein
MLSIQQKSQELQPTNRSIDRSINQSTNRSINQSVETHLGTRLIEGRALDLLPLEVGHRIHEVEAHAALHTRTKGQYL